LKRRDESKKKNTKKGGVQRRYSLRHQLPGGYKSGNLKSEEEKVGGGGGNHWSPIYTRNHWGEGTIFEGENNGTHVLKGKNT